MHHVLKSENPRDKTFKFGVSHKLCVQHIVKDLNVSMSVRPRGRSKHTKKCDYLTQALSGEDKTDAIDSLAMHVMFWGNMKLEARRHMMCEWSYFYAYIGSKGHTRKKSDIADAR